MNQSENEKLRVAADRKGIVGDIGEHLVCFELSRLELRAVRTKAGAKGVDIIAYDPDTYRTATIQVKATTGATYPSAVFTSRDEQYDHGEAERDENFCSSPLPDFVVLVKLVDHSSYDVEGLYVWHRDEKHLLLARRVPNKPKQACWTLSGFDARIKGGRSQEDGKTHPSQYQEPRTALEKIKRHLESKPDAKRGD